jgi:PEGA domain
VGTACLVGLAEAAGVGSIIAGELRHRGGTNRLDLILIDTNKRAVISQGVVEFTGEIQKSQIEELRLAMFEPDRYRGEIKLACSVDGAEVFVDGTKVGVTPLPLTIKNVVAGPKKLEVTRPGYRTFIANFYLAPGKTKEVVATLPEVTGVSKSISFFSVSPFHKSPIFWTLTGAGAAGLVAAIWLNVNSDKLQNNANYLKAHHLAGYQAEKDRADSQRLGAAIAYGVSGLMLIAAGTIVALDLLGATSGNSGRADSADVHASIIPSYNGAMVVTSWWF